MKISELLVTEDAPGSLGSSPLASSSKPSGQPGPTGPAVPAPAPGSSTVAPTAGQPAGGPTGPISAAGAAPVPTPPGTIAPTTMTPAQQIADLTQRLTALGGLPK